VIDVGENIPLSSRCDDENNNGVIEMTRAGKIVWVNLAALPSRIFSLCLVLLSGLVLIQFR